MADDKIRIAERNPAGCPLDPVLKFLALKWLVHIVWFLGQKPSLRFAELRRQLPGRVSAKILSQRLKQLEGLALVEREDKGTKQPHVTYRLTMGGRAMNDFLVAIEQQARKLSLPVTFSRTQASRH
jgi:DNA-binding HxlR family transcriptional regulator